MVSVSVWILKFGFVEVRSWLNSLLFLGCVCRCLLSLVCYNVVYCC